MDGPTIAALIAAGVALLVGRGGVAASFYQASRVARATVRAQLNAATVDALVSVMRHVELSGLAIQDRIFNLTVAEHEGDEFAGYEPGPSHRDVHDPQRSDFAESSALVAAHGDAAVRRAFDEWAAAVTAWDDRYETLRFNWWEGDRNRTRPEDVAAERDGERDTRRRLGAAVNANLRNLARV